MTVVDPPHTGELQGGGAARDDRFVDDRTQPVGEVLDQRSIARRQASLVATHSPALAASQDHEAAAAPHGKSLPWLAPGRWGRGCRGSGSGPGAPARPN